MRFKKALEPLRVDVAAQMYKTYQDTLSLRGFCERVNVPRWRLRYYLKTERRRQQKHKILAQEKRWVKDVALNHKPYGYRGVYGELNKPYKLGRENVRCHMAVLGLKQQVPKRKRKPAPEVSKVCDLAAGRKVQMDATRFALRDGIAGKYVVEDVASRACLALKTLKKLSQEAAASALLGAKHTLENLGIVETLVVQSEAGSDFGCVKLLQNYVILFVGLNTEGNFGG